MLTFTLYNETGKDLDSSEMMNNMKEEGNQPENEFKAQKRSRKSEKSKSKSNIPEVADDDMHSSESERRKAKNTNLPLSAKKKIKKESPEDEVEKIFKAEPVETSEKSQEKSKFIFKIIYDNTKNREFSEIGVDELWTLVSKNKDFSKHNIRTKDDLIQIVVALDVQGKCLYSEKDKNITLV